MISPSVVCVCLTADRQDMTDRAVRSFLSQTYERKELLIFDTGRVKYQRPDQLLYDPSINHWREDAGGRSIGKLRNAANSHCQSDVLIHWDSDDWSHPERISNQVELLNRNHGLHAVGYNSMLFWRKYEWLAQDDGWSIIPGEAWRYDHPMNDWAFGTSLCYWRDAWEDIKFPDSRNGEDTQWLRSGIKARGIGAYRETEDPPYKVEPYMVASMHDGNTALTKQFEKGRSTDVWTRVAQWDDRIKMIMEAA